MSDNESDGGEPAWQDFDLDAALADEGPGDGASESGAPPDKEAPSEAGDAPEPADGKADDDGDGDALPDDDADAPAPDGEEAPYLSGEDAKADDADDAGAEENSARSQDETKLAPGEPSAPQLYSTHAAMLQRSNAPATIRIVPAAARVTSNVLQQHELAQVLAMRSEQISRSATAFIDYGVNNAAGTAALTDAISIAKAELAARRCPLILRRAVGIDPDGVPCYEDWRVNEMTLPPF